MLYVAHGQAEAFAEMEHPATCLFVQCGHCGTALYTGVEMLPVFQPLLLVRRPSLSRTQTGCMRSSTMASGHWPVWSAVVCTWSRGMGTSSPASVSWPTAWLGN